MMDFINRMFKKLGLLVKGEDLELIGRGFEPWHLLQEGM